MDSPYMTDEIILALDRGVPIEELVRKYELTAAEVSAIYARKPAIIAERLAKMPNLAKAQMEQAANRLLDMRGAK